MFDHKHYVPILKAKQGEFSALRGLGPVSKKALTPLLEVPPVPWDYDLDAPKVTIDEHLEKLPAKVKDAWGSDRRLFLDLWYVKDEAGAGGTYPLVLLFDRLRAEGIQAVPVVGPQYPAAYMAAAAAVIKKDARGACIRLRRESLEDADEISPALAAVLKAIGLAPKDVDLLLDYEFVGEAGDGWVASVASAQLLTLPHIADWRTLTISGAAFPKDLTALTRNATSLVTRAEWLAWKRLAARRTRLPRMPTFGDYAIAHPDPFEGDGRLMHITAQLRYAITDEWLVFKGQSVRTHPLGHDQFYDICAQMATRPEYAGPKFSEGDRLIDEKAKKIGGPGNPQVWRQIGTSHHLTAVTSQIASHPGL